MLVQHDLTRRVIGLAIDVHAALGPGLLESVYENCLAFELTQAKIPFQRQARVPVHYRGNKLETGFRADLIVNDNLLIEIKAVDRLSPAHEAQLLTYLRMSGCEVALLMNFNAPRLKDGLRRFVRTPHPQPAEPALSSSEPPSRSPCAP